jgi:hypothetical protein
MAMQRQTWSINGLSAELGMDRRTLSDRLDGLPPTETKQLANRIENRWYLSDVLAHLEDPNASAGIDAAVTGFKEILTKNLYPSIVASKSFGAIISNGLQDELGLTEAQGMRAFQLAGVALSFALCEVLEDDGLDFQIPDFIVEMHELGIDGYLKKHSQTA